MGDGTVARGISVFFSLSLPLARPHCACLCLSEWLCSLCMCIAILLSFEWHSTISTEYNGEHVNNKMGLTQCHTFINDFLWEKYVKEEIEMGIER